MTRPQPFPAPIYITRPLTPPLSEYKALLDGVWSSGWFTNNGALHQALEEQLGTYLRVPYLSLFNNGTIALVVACQVLRLRGEVITTPFTFPATPHVLRWNGLTPVFADIDYDTMNLDPRSVEGLISPQTSGILGVHVYGHPCDTVMLQAIADRHGLRVIYDAAHAFTTRTATGSVCQRGDITMLSFHATKLFHTAEGGALVVHDPWLKERIDLLKNFGIKNELEVAVPGINGKMSELHAALGLVNLRYVDAERARRAALTARYNEKLANLPGVRCMLPREGVEASQQYYVLRINREHAGCSRDELHDQLKAFNIYTRRYFYPLCSEYDCYRDLPSASPQRLPVAHRVADEVLTLPLYGALSTDDVDHVCDAIIYVLAH